MRVFRRFVIPDRATPRYEARHRWWIQRRPISIDVLDLPPVAHAYWMEYAGIQYASSYCGVEDR